MIGETPLLRIWTVAVTLGCMMGIAVFIASGMKFRWRTFLLSVGIMASEAVITLLFFGADSPFKMWLMAGMVLLINFAVYRFRGRKLLLQSFVSLLVTFCADVIAGLVCISLFDEQTIADMRYMTSPVTYILQGCAGGMMILLALVWRGGTYLMRNRRMLARISYILRPVLMLTVICALFVHALSDLGGGDQRERLGQILPDFIVIALLLITGVTYVAQDIQHFQQLQRNRELLHQQSLQELLLQDTRVFRHNISNMLYGLQGTLLGGDIDALNAYYRRMIEACQLINNENVVALKRIPSLAVSSLLLNKIQQANAARIPFFCTVEEELLWRGLRDDEMTQLLGVLIDNAMEAAAEANAPYVSFEARNVGGTDSDGNALSIVIRNTYREGEPPVFTPDMPSTKPTHEGLGLRSVHQMLRHRRNVLFNIYAHGRYVEASVICY